MVEFSILSWEFYNLHLYVPLHSCFFTVFLDQTPEEIERTKQFSYEVIDLLKNCPQCCMVFNKFIPSYHHHFGRQCRVADYGFSKLIELFEAIPDIINVSPMSKQ